VWTINLLDAASNLNPKVSGWIGDWRSSAKFVAGANIFSFDFFQVGGLVGTVIALNDRKQPSSLPQAGHPAEGASQPTGRKPWSG
jgi:hypothetical protein